MHHYLTIGNGVTDIDFYENAFNAKELWRLHNDDGSIHVAGFLIDDAMFHLHEQMPDSGAFTAHALKGVTTKIGLMTDDVHKVVDSAVAAGAKLISPVQDYDYGYRQGEITDPFGHHWIIQKIIDEEPLKHITWSFK